MPNPLQTKHQAGAGRQAAGPVTGVGGQERAGAGRQAAGPGTEGRGQGRSQGRSEAVCLLVTLLTQPSLSQVSVVCLSPTLLTPSQQCGRTRTSGRGLEQLHWLGNVLSALDRDHVLLAVVNRNVTLYLQHTMYHVRGLNKIETS